MRARSSPTVTEVHPHCYLRDDSKSETSTCPRQSWNNSVLHSCSLMLESHVQDHMAVNDSTNIHTQLSCPKSRAHSSRLRAAGPSRKLRASCSHHQPAPLSLLLQLNFHPPNRFPHRRTITKSEEPPFASSGQDPLAKGFYIHSRE